MARTKINGDKIPPMHLACSRNDLHPNMNCVYIKNGFATATDAFVLVKYDLNDILRDDVLKAMDGKLIHRELWKIMASVRSWQILIHNGNLVVQKGYIQTLVTFYDDKYPDTDSVIRKAFDSEIMEIGAMKVNFNPGKLKIVSDIFGHKESIASIQISQKVSTHLVCLCGSSDAVAIIMPVQQFVTLDVPSKFIPA